MKFHKSGEIYIRAVGREDHIFNKQVSLEALKKTNTDSSSAQLDNHLPPAVRLANLYLKVPITG